jgi:hypothetical protein
MINFYHEIYIFVHMGILYLPQQQILLAPPKTIFNIERSNDLMSLLVIPNGDEIKQNSCFVDGGS